MSPYPKDSGLQPKKREIKRVKKKKWKSRIIIDKEEYKEIADNQTPKC